MLNHFFGSIFKKSLNYFRKWIVYKKRCIHSRVRIAQFDVFDLSVISFVPMTKSISVRCDRTHQMGKSVFCNEFCNFHISSCRIRIYIFFFDENPKIFVWRNFGKCLFGKNVFNQTREASLTELLFVNLHCLIFNSKN